MGLKLEIKWENPVVDTLDVLDTNNLTLEEWDALPEEEREELEIQMLDNIRDGFHLTVQKLTYHREEEE